MYFSQPTEHVVDRARSAFESGRASNSFVWGYGHLVVFASAAAVGSGIAVAADRATGHSELSARGAALAVAIPVALYMLSVWAIIGRHKDRTHVGPVTAPRAALAVLLIGTLTTSILAIGLLTAATVATFVLAEPPEPAT
jgi:low temperature requirement protein LtrA